MATSLGRETIILAGTSDPPADNVDYVRNSTVSKPLTIANSTSNNTGAGMGREYVRKDFEIKIPMIADPSLTGQDHFTNAYDTLTKIWLIIRPQGTGGGLPQYKGRFVVSDIQEGQPLDDQDTIEVTCQIDGLIDATAQ